MAQKKTDDTTITTGQWVSTQDIKYTAAVSDPDSDQVQLCVEKDQLGTSFSNTEDSCGSLVASGGTATVTISGQTGAVSNEQFTITYKIAVSQSQAASVYQGNINYIITANY